jgi:hypothetical protein
MPDRNAERTQLVRQFPVLSVGQMHLLPSLKAIARFFIMRQIIQMDWRPTKRSKSPLKSKARHAQDKSLSMTNATTWQTVHCFWFRV